MPKQYGDDAIQKARELYCKFGGKDFDAIEAEMRKTFPTWRKQNLISRGKGSDSRLGWVDSYQFDKSLVEYQRIQIAAVTDDIQKLYLGIKKTREKLEKTTRIFATLSTLNNNTAIYSLLFILSLSLAIMFIPTLFR